MKTIDLDDVKETVMKRHGYKQKYWCSLPVGDREMLSDYVAEEYAKQCCDEQKKIIAEKFLFECKSKALADTIYKSTLSTPNVVTLKTK